MVSLFGQGLEVSDTLLQSILLLLGGDALLDVLDDPVDHVFLLVGSQNVGGLQLVVQATLYLQNNWNFQFWKSFRCEAYTGALFLGYEQ